jgi:hypothetical protein
MSKGTRTTGVGGRWKQWSEGEARAALAELVRSGESASAFARSRGFSTQRIAYWRKRLGGASTPAFVSVAMPPVSALRAPIEIVVGDVIVRVREEADVEQLARIVEALARGGRGC